jgi:hypothetical protein
MTLAAILAVLLAIACVAFVARPFLREPAPEDDHLARLTDEERGRMELIEAQARIHI